MKYRIDYLDGTRQEIELTGTMKEILSKKYQIDENLKNVAYTEELWDGDDD